jgi:hypothetical protein
MHPIGEDLFHRDFVLLNLIVQTFDSFRYHFGVMALKAIADHSVHIAHVSVDHNAARGKFGILQEQVRLQSFDFDVQMFPHDFNLVQTNEIIQFCRGSFYAHNGINGAQEKNRRKNAQPDNDSILHK